MMADLRSLWRETSLLWRTIARILRQRGPVLALLLLFGWAGYHLTVFLTGAIAPYSPWAVIPLMSAGCLIQLTVMLAVYRGAIYPAEDLLGVPKLARLPLMTLVSTLLVPFAAAYSAFGYFGQYARSALIAAYSVVGTLANSAFIEAVNPLASRRTLITCLIAFVVLWLAARLVKAWSAKIKNPPLALVSSYISGCSTFLALFSIVHLYAWIGAWIHARRFNSWTAQITTWFGQHLGFDFPAVVRTIASWVSGTAWPFFWQALSQPILWLVIVAVVGGMSFTNVSSVWERLRTRLGIQRRANADVVKGLKLVGQKVLGQIESLLPFFHLLSVILRSGVPFLATLVISYALVGQLGAWLSWGVYRLAGPVSPKWVLMVSPLFDMVDQVIVPGVEAVLLAAAYVRLRQTDADLGFQRPRGLGWKPLLVAVLAVLVAVGVNQAAPGSANRTVELTPGKAAALFHTTVTLSDPRFGYSLDGTVPLQPDMGTVTSTGVFVAVRVDISSRQGATVVVTAEADGVSYVPWDGEAQISCNAGFEASRDVVFEVPATSLDQLTILVRGLEFVSITSENAVLDLGGAGTVEDLITIDQTIETKGVS